MRLVFGLTLVVPLRLLVLSALGLIVLVVDGRGFFGGLDLVLEAVGFGGDVAGGGLGLADLAGLFGGGLLLGLGAGEEGGGERG